MDVNVPGYAPADKGIFVHLSLSGTEIIGTRHVNSRFWYALNVVSVVSEFVEAESVKNRNFSTFSPHPDFRDLSL